MTSSRYGRMTTPLQALALRDQILAVLRDAGRALTTREVCDRIGEVTVRSRLGCDGTHSCGLIPLSCQPTGHRVPGGWELVVHVTRRPAVPRDLHGHLSWLAANGRILRVPVSRFNSVMWTVFQCPLG